MSSVFSRDFLAKLPIWRTVYYCISERDRLDRHTGKVKVKVKVKVKAKE